MTAPEAQPQHPTPHSEETADVTDTELGTPATPADEEPHPDDVDDRPMSAPGGVNTDIDRIFGDDSER